MNNKHQRIKFFQGIALCFFFVGCTQKTEEKKQEIKISQTIQEVVPEKPVAPEPVQTAEIAPIQKTAIDQSWIATLKSSTNRVDFKSKSEATWQAVTADMNFYKYDSLQTHQKSTALVRYQSKSELDVKEKTLLVFDEDPGSNKRKSDRVILKAGDLLGKTNTELWVLTDSGLVQITAEKTKTAKARVQIKNDQFKVVVDQGTALVTVKNQNNEVQKIAITQNNTVELDMQKQIRPFVNKGDSEQAFETVVNQSEAIGKPIEQKVTLDNLDETEFTKKSPYQLVGKASAVGARLLVNGEIVLIGSDLKFSKEIPLNKGSNLIVLQVIRSDSTTQFIRKKVVLED